MSTISSFCLKSRKFSGLKMMSSISSTIVLERGKARVFQDGNPIIYSGAVKEIKGNPNPGDECLVTDHMNNLIGRGVFNPFSQYRVRMLARNYESVFKLPLESLLKHRLQEAINLRKAILLPSESTTVYR